MALNIVSRLELNDSDLIAPEHLRGLDGIAENVRIHISNYSETLVVGQLTRANNSVNQLVQESYRLPAAPPGKSGPYTRAVNVAASKMEDLAKRTEQSERNNEKLQESQKEIDSELRGKVKEATANWDEEFSSTHQGLKDKADKATELLQMVGTGALGKQYASEQAEQSSHDNQWTALGFTGLVLVIAVVIFAKDAAYGVTWAEVPGRFITNSPLIAALTAISTVGFRRAGYHRRREERASRIVNELRMLYAFTDDLPESLRYAVLAQITPRYFVGGGTEEQQVTEATGLGDLLTNIPGVRTDAE